MPSPIGVVLASLARDAAVDEIALATLDAAIVAAVVNVEVPLEPPAAAGKVDDEERTVMRGVEVTPVFSLARRKLGIDLAGCGLAAVVLMLVFELDPFNRGVEASLDEVELQAVEPAVPGRCIFVCCATVDCGFSEVRVVVDSWVPALLVDAAESAGLDRPLDSDARLLVDSTGRRTGVPTRRGDSLDAGVFEAGSPLAPMRGVI